VDEAALRPEPLERSGKAALRSVSTERSRAEDTVIWSYARDKGFVIVSKDSDFQQRSLLLGAPPKVVWLRVGNCPTQQIEKLLMDHSVELHTFERDELQSLLILS
jgi:predicted nuclease of predicted toxin-antitoxin system